MHLNIEKIEDVQNAELINSSDDYSKILRSFNLKYELEGYYWKVGNITKTQNWILHLSVVLSQAVELLTTIIPFLKDKEVPFKIVMNETCLEELLIGNLGLSQIGKVVRIYPESETKANILAKELISLTSSYKGPAIPTDICLNNIVYTRYGSFSPVIKLDQNGNEEKYIYNATGELIRDPYSIPFRMPEDIKWPFADIAPATLLRPSRLLNHIYKIVDILKADPKGNVFKGLYVKGIFRVQQCVIKQGFANMCSDKAGRDIKDRLAWQKELYNRLSDIVPMPVIYDFFEDQGSSILVMKFIKGPSLFNKLNEINPLSNAWEDLPKSDSFRLLKYAIVITQIIGRMHERGYVHRDIVPMNFIITKKDKIILIDIELAYCLFQNTPNPPFQLGTPGFMSPEQEASLCPSVHEDTYGLGATLLHIFTGCLPIKFNTTSTKELVKSLCFFIGNTEIASTIANCLHPDPKSRPAITSILKSLMKYQRELETNSSISRSTYFQKYSQATNLRALISLGLDGLTKEPIVISRNLWYSKQITIENFTAPKNVQYTISPGTVEGLTGVLYALARINRFGINIDPCREAFSKGWTYVESKFLRHFTDFAPGLYYGASGFSLALSEGIRSGLLANDEINRDRILKCLTLPNKSIDLADGIAGQGLALLLCKDLLAENIAKPLLDKTVDHLLSKQLDSGRWINQTEYKTKKVNKIPNMGYDDMGIVWFLLEYSSRYPDVSVKCAIAKCLEEHFTDKSYMKYLFNLISSKESYDFGDGGKGIIVTLLNAYEILREDKYRKIAEAALLKYPPRVMHTSFTALSGLAALGELYLEAWRVLKSDEWKSRADHLVDLYGNTLYRTSNASGFWVMEQNNPSTADLLTGNSGIIHFLARRLYYKKMPYRLIK